MAIWNTMAARQRARVALRDIWNTMAAGQPVSEECRVVEDELNSFVECQVGFPANSSTASANNGVGIDSVTSAGCSGRLRVARVAYGRRVERQHQRQQQQQLAVLRYGLCRLGGNSQRASDDESSILMVLDESADEDEARRKPPPPHRFPSAAPISEAENGDHFLSAQGGKNLWQFPSSSLFSEKKKGSAPPPSAECGAGHAVGRDGQSDVANATARGIADPDPVDEASVLLRRLQQQRRDARQTCQNDLRPTTVGKDVIITTVAASESGSEEEAVVIGESGGGYGLSIRDGRKSNPRRSCGSSDGIESYHEGGPRVKKGSSGGGGGDDDAIDEEVGGGADAVSLSSVARETEGTNSSLGPRLPTPTSSHFLHLLLLLLTLVNSRSSSFASYHLALHVQPIDYDVVLEYGEKVWNGKGSNRQEGEPRMNEHTIKHYWTDMLEAVSLRTIHEERIVHSDLKPTDFLLLQGEVKLIDFGIAKQLERDTTNIHWSEMVGTLNYMAPEKLELKMAGTGMKVGRSSDIWSLGCRAFQSVPEDAGLVSSSQQRVLGCILYQMVYLCQMRPLEGEELPGLQVVEKLIDASKDDACRVLQVLNDWYGLRRGTNEMQLAKSIDSVRYGNSHGGGEVVSGPGPSSGSAGPAGARPVVVPSAEHPQQDAVNSKRERHASSGYENQDHHYNHQYRRQQQHQPQQQRQQQYDDDGGDI
ncbi:hypothetical protein CBR_g32625 [Chara braunii]|uniref:Protein kinase domain-containing protein n=1 Tax=Chara braunii TaxID=69332 RepID=A0A388LHE8_CHABU|nr:hypothetical protein CBR_g32625 [Chara braunii]|eukprot:GBG81632.1 hypothetical protein CBR_g32625 [Chara braunii]